MQSWYRKKKSNANAWDMQCNEKRDERTQTKLLRASIEHQLLLWTNYTRMQPPHLGHTRRHRYIHTRLLLFTILVSLFCNIVIITF